MGLKYDPQTSSFSIIRELRDASYWAPLNTYGKCLRTTGISLLELSVSWRLLLIQKLLCDLCWHSKTEEVDLYFTSAGSLSLLLDVGMEAYSPDCHWQPPRGTQP